jgi:hypothetical protein
MTAPNTNAILNADLPRIATALEAIVDELRTANLIAARGFLPSTLGSDPRTTEIMERLGK